MNVAYLFFSFNDLKFNYSSFPKKKRCLFLDKSSLIMIVNIFNDPQMFKICYPKVSKEKCFLNFPTNIDK